MSEIIFRIIRRIVRWYNEMENAQIKRRLRSCGANVRIGRHVIIWSEAEVSIADHVEINSFTHIFGGGGVSIGAATLISAGCSIASVTHETNDFARSQSPIVRRPVLIGRNVWIGTGAIILPGVVIGDDAVIGAGAVVTHDIPPAVVAVGIPARVVRQIVRGSAS